MEEKGLVSSKLSQLGDNRVISTLCHWRPRTKRRSVGRLPTRRSDGRSGNALDAGSTEPVCLATLEEAMFSSGRPPAGIKMMMNVTYILVA